ncbi:hypothetical protein C5748_18070 [Phyllobacterium phragmitis]|uniref:Uncharacterized protein n=1 Tax=Phyllobacterium phragmitis TaxID=2670329 RepID=A0A2S9INF9_9HYPH|nr:hypothetical protein [Phyllobacterium phragmitis]PRD42064.1 hypothetical protein C5748_18070 [Phyllobacterium phragmitis]
MTPKTHQELVERVARRIDPYAWSDPSMAIRQRVSQKTAEAAISEVYAAVEEPTLDMLTGGINAFLDDPERKQSTLWRAMLAASPLAKEG